MAMTDLGSYIPIPNWAAQPIVYHSALVMDATGERLGLILPIHKAGNIHTVKVYTGAIAAGKGDTLKVSIQGVNSSNVPDGTILGAGGGGYTTIVIADTDDFRWMSGTLGADVPVVQGQHIAMVVEWNSYVAGAIQFNQFVFGTTYNYYNIEVVTDITATPGTWAVVSNNNNPAFAMAYDDGTYVRGTGGISTTGISLSTGTTPDEVGNYFTVPVSCRVCGFWLYLDMDYACTLSLQNTSGTTLANVVTSPDYRKAASDGILYYLFDSDPASYYDLTAGTYYRMVVTPSSASNITYTKVIVAAAADMSAFDLGTSCIFTSRTDGGSWSQTDTERLNMGLIISHIDVGSGGGGGPLISGRLVR